MKILLALFLTKPDYMDIYSKLRCEPKQSPRFSGPHKILQGFSGSITGAGEGGGAQSGYLLHQKSQIYTSNIISKKNDTQERRGTL